MQRAIDESLREAGKAPPEPSVTPQRAPASAAAGGAADVFTTPGFSPPTRGKHQGSGSASTEYCLLSIVLHQGSTGHSGALWQR